MIVKYLEKAINPIYHLLVEAMLFPIKHLELA